jgi:hypothetical protein
LNASPTSSQTLLTITTLSGWEVCCNNFCRSVPPTPNKSSDFALTLPLSFYVNTFERTPKIMGSICTNRLEYLVHFSVHGVFPISSTLS